MSLLRTVCKLALCGELIIKCWQIPSYSEASSHLLAESQQQSLLRLALEGISVYSPHTAVDAAPGGLGDWLADIVTGTLPGPPEAETHTAAIPKEEAEPALDDSEKNTPHERPEDKDQAQKNGESTQTPGTQTQQTAKELPKRPSINPRQSTY